MASPATTVADAVMFVLVAVSLFAETVPPTGDRSNDVGAVGATVSTAIEEVLANEPDAPGVISVRFAKFPTASLMIPPLSSNAPED